MRPDRAADRFGTHIPGFSGPLSFIAILHNFFPPITLAGTAVQSGLGQNRPKIVFSAADYGRTDRPTGLTGTSLKPAGNADVNFFGHSPSKWGGVPRNYKFSL